MGAVNSCWLPRYQNPNVCRENHTSTPRGKGHRRNLSAVFNLADMETDINVDQLNINTATEEELMTLPGINRVTAHNIIDYRRQIGIFKKVEDLALVSGVGATKLQQIRMEICVNRKKSSQSSSRSSSRQDLSMQDNASKSSGRSHTRTNSAYFLKVCINTANVFQLMKVKYITQQIGENIIIYRDKKGLFKSLDDLLKVKGINPAILSAIRPHLVLQEELIDRTISAPAEMTYVNGGSSHHRSYSYTNGTPVNNTDVYMITGSQDDLLNTYGPLLNKSFRAKKVPPVLRQDSNKPILRVATWNVDNLTEEKSCNPGVKEVICMTILENGWSIVAVQDLKSPKALQNICDELNAPTIPKVRKWPGQRGVWKTHTLRTPEPSSEDYVGFIYNTTQQVELTSPLASTLTSSTDGKDESCLQPLVAHFTIGNKDLIVVNLHVRSRGEEDEDVGALLQKLFGMLKQQLQDVPTSNVVIMGDVQKTQPITVAEVMESTGYESVQCTCASANSTSTPDLPVQLLCLQKNSQLSAGACGVIQDGLTSPWIPNGWTWGGVASRHAPLWSEVHITQTTRSRDIGGGDNS